MTSAGPCTKMILYEIAANGLGITCGSNLNGVLTAGSKHLDRYTGLEQRFMGEIGYAATKVKREDANELTLQILKKYEKYFYSKE